MIFALLDTLLEVERRAKQVIFLLPLAGRLHGLALDMVHGPADSFEYTVKTAPSSPPPTIS